MKKTALAALLAGFAAVSMVACGGSDDEDGGSGGSYVGDWHAHVEAGMGGADPDPELDIEFTFAGDGTGTLSIMADEPPVGAITINYDVTWEEEGDEIHVMGTCSGVDPDIVTCDLLAEDGLDVAEMHCSVDGDDMTCTDDAGDDVEFHRE